MTIYQNINVYLAIKLRIHLNFLITILINLFCCWEKVFIHNVYMGEWKRFHETSLTKKQDFYSNINMEDITESNYNHTKRVCKDFEIKNLDECHGLYLKNNTLLLTGAFENFRKMCLEIYELDTAKFLSAPELAWQAALKKTKVKLDLLTNIDMILIVENVLEEEYNNK